MVTFPDRTTPGYQGPDAAASCPLHAMNRQQHQGRTTRHEEQPLTTSNAPPAPTGEGVPAADAKPASRQNEVKTDNVLEAVLASDNLARAWQRVKSNKGAPGIDGVTIEDWPAHARAHWTALREQIRDGRYRPQAVRRVEIPKPDGGKRLLGIPTVTDRVIQQAIAQVLTPIFDPEF